MLADGERWKIVEGDCLEAMRGMEAGSVDIAITSPPYNLGGEPWPHLGHWKPGDGGSGSKSKWRNGSDACGGVDYGTHIDAMPWAEYVAWQRAVISSMWRCISDCGAVFYNHKPRVIGGKLWTPLELVPEDVIVRQIIIWARPGGINFNATAFVPTHEWIMVLAKPAFRLKSKGVSGLGDVWRMTPDKNDHPAPFPLELPMRILEAVDADIVLDPFAGSGTVGKACLQMGRSFIGVELNPEYAANARRRLTAADDARMGTLFA